MPPKPIPENLEPFYKLLCRFLKRARYLSVKKYPFLHEQIIQLRKSRQNLATRLNYYKHHQKELAHKKEYYHKNKSAILKKQKAKREQNKKTFNAHHREYVKQYRQRYPEKHREYQHRTYHKHYAKYPTKKIYSHTYPISEKTPIIRKLCITGWKIIMQTPAYFKLERRYNPIIKLDIQLTTDTITVNKPYNEK
jgi:hypothetical protein